MPVFLLDVAGDVAGRAKMRPVMDIAGLGYTKDELRQIEEQRLQNIKIDAERDRKEKEVRAQQAAIQSAPGYVDPSELKSIRNQAAQLVAEVVAYNLGPDGQLKDGDLLNLARRMVGSAPAVQVAPVVVRKPLPLPTPVKVIKRVVKPLSRRV